jgi:hypothetical protein
VPLYKVLPQIKFLGPRYFSEGLSCTIELVHPKFAFARMVVSPGASVFPVDAAYSLK